MSRPIVKIHDLQNNEFIEREMNDTEFAQWEADQAAAEAEATAKAEKVAKRQTLLNKLGITEEEAKLLLS
jgi:hypothetical protein